MADEVGTVVGDLDLQPHPLRASLRAGAALPEQSVLDVVIE